MSFHLILFRQVVLPLLLRLFVLMRSMPLRQVHHIDLRVQLLLVLFDLLRPSALEFNCPSRRGATHLHHQAALVYPLHAAHPPLHLLHDLLAHLRLDERAAQLCVV